MADINYHGDVVVFDLDDTLFRERDFVRSGFKLIEKTLCEKYPGLFDGISVLMNDALEKRENYFDILEKKLSTSLGFDFSGEDMQSLMCELIDAYRSHLPEKLPLDSGVAEVLEKLQSQGVVMALVTDGRSVTQRNKIHALGLDEYIPDCNILISEETGFDKTTPENFRTLVRRYPEAKRFIYIADNEHKDFLQPNLLGWETYKVQYNSDNVHEDFVNTDVLQRPCHLLSSISCIFDKMQLIGG